MLCNLTVNELKTLLEHEGLTKSGNKSELCSRLWKHVRELQASEGVYMPEKYLKGLSKSEREKRKKEIAKGAKTKSDDPKAYKASNFSTDFDKKTGKRKKTKTSSYTEAFREMFPDAKSLKVKAEKTGIPQHILKKVYDKGLAAWRTGHRPGATQQQWGHARVNSFIMKGCTYYTADAKLVEKAKDESPKAKRHWASIKKLCKK